MQTILTAILFLKQRYCMSDKYTFSKTDLEEITKIVSIKNIEAASKKFCNRPYVFFALQKLTRNLMKQ